MKTTNPFKRLASHVFPCLGLSLCLLLSLLPLQGCMEDGIKPAGEGTPAKLDLVFPGIAPSQAPQTGSEEDYKITGFTVLVFNGQSSGAPGGQIVKRIDITDLSSGPTGSSIELRTRFYDFVFIGNAASDPALVASLVAFIPGSNKTISDLEGLYVASTAFDSQKDIPTLGVYRGVQILGDNKLKVTPAGPVLTGSWKVVLKRLGIRLDLAIETQEDNLKNSYKQVEIHNIPQRVPLLPANAAGSTIDNYPAGAWQVENPVSRIYNVSQSDNSGAGWVAKVPGPGESITYTRIILPSVMFSPVTDDSKKITLRAVYDNDSYVQTEIVPLADPVGNTNYTSAGNTWYKVRATLVNTGIEIISRPEAWENSEYNASIDGSLLHVERLKASCSNITPARIYFWTGSTPLEQVYVDPNGYTGAPGSGNAEYAVNDVFDDLSGPGASSLHYNAGTGAGYIDLIAKETASAGTQRILLRAGSLRREITVSNGVVTLPPADTWSTAKGWVGAFWRDSQTGERVILYPMAPGTVWSATVDAGSGNLANSVVLAEGGSPDMSFYSDSPGDAEDYQVGGNTTTISGTGNVLFRIGLTTTNPGDFADPAEYNAYAQQLRQPRYATITMRINGADYKLYLRQGEAADYVFRPGDTATGGDMSGGSRTLAAKFSPYNLTASDLTDGDQYKQITVGTNNVFTDYPTQAGAFFQWANDYNPRYAYHPVNPLGSVSGWQNNNASGYWTDASMLRDNHETCPPGYRRMTAGKTDGDITPNASESELMQSLFYNTFNGGSSNTNNTNFRYWGFYADGYYDRRSHIHAAYGTYGVANTGVSTTTKNIAYIGQLFTNPATNASLFLPASGYRYSSDGTLYTPGSYGYYWSSSSSNANRGWNLYLTSSNANQNAATRSNGWSLRCVR